MTAKKVFARRSLVVSLFFMVMILLVFRTAFETGLNVLESQLNASLRAGEATPAVKAVVEQVRLTVYDYRFYVVPAAAGVLVFFAILQWFFLGWAFRSSQKREPKAPAVEAAPAAAPAEDPAVRRYREERLFVHLVSTLQKEGRLLDFFAENLDPYDDAQIGAAVRNIHENCRKAVDKTLSPAPVIDQIEGQEVTVETGFDTGEVKLTGNVAGEPPFRGVLRHRGWQAGRIELPTFSGGQDARIIAPAEVEMM